jgi:hypothetical protein
VGTLAAILRRWGDIIAYAALAAVFHALSADWLTALTAPLIEKLEVIHPTLIPLVAVMITTAPLYPAAAGRFWGFLGLKYAFRYPPLAFAVVGGTAIYALCLTESARTALAINDVFFVKDIMTPIGWLSIAIYFGCFALFSRLIRTKSTPSQLRKTGAIVSVRNPHANITRVPTELEVDFDRLQRWVADDREVESPDQDRFGHARVAERIVKRITETREPPTIALIGPRGSGKTSVANLVQHYLKPHSRYRIMRLSLWQYDSTEAAVRGILQSLIQELGLVTNVLGLRGLSDDYMTAIEGVAGRFGAITRLLRGSAEPTSILRTISEIAQAIDVHVIIWVEDLERFAAGNSAALGGDSADANDRLEAIRVLLYMLDRCPGVSVVYAATSMAARFDVDKIARFIEEPPPLRGEDVYRIFDTVRKAALSGWPAAWVDPVPGHVRDKAFPAPHDGTFLRWLDESQLDGYSIPKALAVLLRTPRAMKHTLRLSLESWTSLCGEVDLDDLLLAHVLRVSRPTVFSFVHEHITLVRRGFLRAQGLASRKGLGAEPTSDPGYRAMKQRIEASAAPEVATATWTILKAIFPALDGVDFGHLESNPDRPQRLYSENPSDYWRRLASEAIESDSKRDQPTLQSIQAWNKAAQSDLVDRICSPDLNGSVEQFSYLIDNHYQLFVMMIRHYLDQPAEAWDCDKAPSGIVCMRRMLRHQAPSAKLAEAILSLIPDLAARHHPLLQEVEYWFCDPLSMEPSLLRIEERRQIRLSIVKALRDMARSPASQLIGAQRHGEHWRLQALCYGHDDLRPIPPTIVPFDSWPEFAAFMIEACRTDPASGIRLVLPFIVDSNYDHRDVIDDQRRRRTQIVYRSTVRLDTLTALFDHDNLRILSIVLATEPIIPTENPALQEQIRAIREWAVSFIAENPAPSTP